MWVKKQQLGPDMEQLIVPNWERSTTRLCVVTLLCNFYAECIMQNANLDKSQVGVTITGRNNNLRFAYTTTLMAESEEELKSLLMKVKEKSEKAGLKLDIQKTKFMISGPITSWQIDGAAVETVIDFIFLDSTITVDSDLNHEIKRHLLLRRKL